MSDKYKVVCYDGKNDTNRREYCIDGKIKILVYSNCVDVVIKKGDDEEEAIYYFDTNDVRIFIYSPEELVEYIENIVWRWCNEINNR